MADQFSLMKNFELSLCMKAELKVSWDLAKFGSETERKSSQMSFMSFAYRST
jgi:hypothetical protein